jgi:flagellar hook-associated protein 2
MAGIQAGGVGSGLDINGLVTQLVTAEGAARAGRITRHEVAVTTKVSALGSLKGALAVFKGALEPLRTLETFQTRSVVSEDTKRFTATATSTAVAGNYQVEVVHLASAHQIASDGYSGGAATPIGTGTLTISVGTSSFDVTIGGEGTLEDVRKAINAATDNTGVQATLLNSVDGTSLVLTSSKTGANHAIKVVASGGGLADLDYDPAGVMNLKEKREALNSLAHVSGFDVESETNVIEDAIEGVTITLLKAEVGAEFSLDVAVDTSAIVARVQKFVTEYNNLRTQLGKLGSYNAETKAAGPLLGDTLLRGVEDQVRRGLTDPVPGLTGNYTALSSLGIKTSATGALELDTGKLTAAVKADPAAVAQLFGSETGVAGRLYKQVEMRLATGADIESRNKRLSSELKDIAKDKEALTLRLQQIEARYRKQFTALDSLLSKMQSTSSYLAQQLASSAKIGG